MLLALSSDSNPPSSKDDLLVQSPRTVVNTNHWRPPGQNRPGPLGAIHPAAGLLGVQRVASTPTRDLANTGTQDLAKTTSKSASTGKFNHRDNSRNHHYSTGSEVRALAKYQLP
ncbi:hypothetical protein PCASD_24775 [Puccinia coronata f. sp. avenae]|uniref:Uncharacterized protein n=1 Tax=Puccinia coronata f. sp. avenae TaxID=200324 RepID=A0A2N5SEJ3_9BASI|nr:hypothetical protein PCASD_24775 [Puccinia coronata f. sp. avenae]